MAACGLSLWQPPLLLVTHAQLCVLQRWSCGHGRWFVFHVMAVELTSGEWKVFVPDGLAGPPAPHTVVMAEECGSWR